MAMQWRDYEDDVRGPFRLGRDWEVEVEAWRERQTTGLFAIAPMISIKGNYGGDAYEFRAEDLDDPEATVR